MIQRATGPQCLSSRVSGLVDGSLPDDVRDRALAHVVSCPDCRADVEAERLLRHRLQALPDPRPSASLIASLLAMGETGGPMPPRPGHVPGMPRPRPATIGWQQDDDPRVRGISVPSLPWHRVTPGRRSTSRSADLPARPGPTSRPGGRTAGRRRTVVGATAGAVGLGVIAAALASGVPAAQRVAPPDQLRAEASTSGGGTGVDVVLNVPAGGTGEQLAPFAGASAVPGVTTTLLHHLLASASQGTSRGSTSAADSWLPGGRFAAVTYLAQGGTLSGGYLSAPAR